MEVEANLVEARVEVVVAVEVEAAWVAVAVAEVGPAGEIADRRARRSRLKQWRCLHHIAAPRKQPQTWAAARAAAVALQLPS